MKFILFIITTAALLLAGCATPFRAPADVAHIVLERGDSSVVIVEKIWLERKQGPLVVKGYVLKRLNVTDTTQTRSRTYGVRAFNVLRKSTRGVFSRLQFAASKRCMLLPQRPF